jgi:hypothetical protein
VLSEVSTSSSFGCDVDRQINYATVVLAGEPGSTLCSGYDQNMTPNLFSVNLVLGELPLSSENLVFPNLFGIVIYPNMFPFPQSIML